MKSSTLPPISIDAAAYLLAVSSRTVSRLIDRGDLSAIRIGTALAIASESLPDLLFHDLEGGCPRPLLTLHDVAGRLACAPEDVRERTAYGEFETVQIGRSTRWSPAAVDRAAQQEQGA